MAGKVLAFLKGHRKAQVLVVLILACVAADAAYYLLVRLPAAGEVDALAARIESLRASNESAAADIRRYEEFMQGREKLDMFKSLLAMRSEYTEVLKSVYGLAKRDGMKFSSMATQTSALPQTSGLEQMSFNLPVSGKYRDVRKFIYDVESSGLFLNINNLGLTSSEAGVITLSIGLSTYVRS